MSKRAVLIYPGQGAQYIGMGKEFYETYDYVKELYKEASEEISLDLIKLCFEENDKLDLTQYTQPAMVCTELAMTRAVKDELKSSDIEVAYSAGLSLGEYAAVSEAGAMNFKDAVHTVYERGKLMASAIPAGEGAMAAVIDPDPDMLKEVIAETEGAYIANYNSPAQIVITGYKKAVETAVEKLKARGVKRCVMLNVSGPFHSPLLSSAGEALGKVLEGVELGKLHHPYLANVNALEVTEESLVKPYLVRQVSSSVLWQQTVEALIEKGIDLWIEIGPGKTLSSFTKKTMRAYGKQSGKDLSAIKIVNIEKPEDLARLTDL